MTMTPRISVVLPVYNAARYLAEAIESVLGQTLAQFELIAIDDGSTDGSLDMLAAYAKKDRRIRLLCSPHQGATRAMNLGVALAVGEFIARMDADDIAKPDRFARQASYLNDHADVVAVGSYLEIIDPEGALVGVQRWATQHDAIERLLLTGRGGLPHPAAMIRRRTMVEVGGYREEFQVGQDKDLWLRLAERGRLANLPIPLVQYREHSDATSATRRAEQFRSVRRAVAEARVRRGIANRFSPLPTDRPTADDSPEAVRRRWVRVAVQNGHPATAWKHTRWLMQHRPWSSSAWLALATWVRLPLVIRR